MNHNVCSTMPVYHIIAECNIGRLGEWEERNICLACCVIWYSCKPMEGEWRGPEMSPFCLSIAAPSYPIGCVLYTTIPISIIACSYCSCRSSCILSENKYFLLLTHSKTATFFGGGLVHKTWPPLHGALSRERTRRNTILRYTNLCWYRELCFTASLWRIFSRNA